MVRKLMQWFSDQNPNFELRDGSSGLARVNSGELIEHQACRWLASQHAFRNSQAFLKAYFICILFY